MNISIQNYLIALKPRRPEHFLLFSLLLYSLGTFLYFHVTTTVGQIFRLSGFVLFIYTIVKNKKSQPFSGVPLLLYILLLIDIAFITFYTFFIADTSAIGASLYDIGMNIFSSDYFIPSIMPFFLILFKKGYHFDISYLVGLMTLMAVLYLFISPFALINMFLFNYDSSSGLNFHDEGGYGEFINESTLHIVAFETPVILFFWKRYLSKKLWILFLAVPILALFMTLYLARRGNSVIYVSYFVLCYLLYLFFDKKSSKLSTILFGSAALLIGVLFVIIGSDSFLALIFERGMEDTRSEIEQNFYNSIDLSCIIYGRGWYGRYFDSTWAIFRYGLETGYLTLILRGGIIYLFLYVSILLYSGFRGLFFSKSIFVKSFAVMIIISVLSLYPFGWPLFDFYFFLIWVGVFICNNEYYLKLTDSQVKFLFYKKTDILMLWLLNMMHGVSKQQQVKERLLK